MLKIFQRLWQVNWAEQWQYRANLVMYLLFWLVSPVVYLAVWTTIARSQGSVNGLTPNDFVTYYMTLLIVDQLLQHAQRRAHALQALPEFREVLGDELLAHPGLHQPRLEVLEVVSDMFRLSLDELLRKKMQDTKGSNYLAKRRAQKMAGSPNQIQLVPVKAAAGYLAGYGDPEFLDELNTFTLPMLSPGRRRRPGRHAAGPPRPVPGPRPGAPAPPPDPRPPTTPRPEARPRSRHRIAGQFPHETVVEFEFDEIDWRRGDCGGNYSLLHAVAFKLL